MASDPHPEDPRPSDGLGPLNDPQWVPQNAIQALTMYEQYNTGVSEPETPVEFSNRLVQEWLPAVTMGMIHIALHSVDERIRMSAQKYLMDRSMGTPPAAELPSGSNSAFKELLDGVLVEGQVTSITSAANTGNSGSASSEAQDG